MSNEKEKLEAKGVPILNLSLGYGRVCQKLQGRLFGDSKKLDIAICH